MKNTTYFLLIILALGICGTRIYKGVVFKQNVKGYLKRAADANTVELASGELKKVIDYLEENNLTNGYTSILWETPDEDIDFWYRNIKASQAELLKLPPDADNLEKTNMLIKLRETLIDSGEKMKVTVPDGIAVYPNNKFWGGLMTVALIAGFWGFMGIIAEYEKKEKLKREQNSAKEPTNK